MPIIRLDPDSPMGSQLQKLQTLYYALIAVPLLVFMLFYLQASQPQYRPYLQGDDLLWFHGLVWVVVVILGALVVKNYNSRIKAYAGPPTLEEKFNSYVSESRRLYFIITPLMFLPVLAIWLTGVIFYGALFSLMIILVASLRPMVEQFIQRYRLSKEEQAELMRLT